MSATSPGEPSGKRPTGQRFWTACREMGGLVWRVFWKVTIAVTLLLTVWVFSRDYPDELPRGWEWPVAIAVVGGICLVWGAWIGLAAALLAAAWRLWRWWTVLVGLGTLAAAGIAASLALLALGTIDWSGGVHGGGQVAAVIALMLLAAAAAIGAAAGGCASLLLVIVLARRSRFRTPDT